MKPAIAFLLVCLAGCAGNSLSTGLRVSIDDVRKNPRLFADSHVIIEGTLCSFGGEGSWLVSRNQATQSTEEPVVILSYPRGTSAPSGVTALQRKYGAFRKSTVLPTLPYGQSDGRIDVTIEGIIRLPKPGKHRIDCEGEEVFEASPWWRCGVDIEEVLISGQYEILPKESPQKRSGVLP
jgi:hypothetical protein